MNVFRAVICWTSLLLLAVPATAKRPIELDPSAAYVVVEIGNVINPVFKGTKLPGNIALARFDPIAGDVRGGFRSRDTALAQPADVRAVVSRQIGKSSAGRLYLFKLAPDSWVIEGSGGTAFSLGSKYFTVRAGEIVDLGIITPAVDWAEGEGASSMIGGSMMGMILFGGRKPETRPMRLDMRTRTAADASVPAEIATRMTPTTLSESAGFANYLGGLVNRIGGRATRPKPQ